MFKMTFVPRVNETNAAGHISNTTLPIWLEEARDPIFKVFNPELDFANWPLILAHIDLDFIRQVHFGSDVVIRTFVKDVGNSSVTVLQEAWQKAELVARGTAVLVHFDYKIQKTAPIPEMVRKTLEKHQLEGHEVIHNH